jgi:hypothetical protein
MESALFCVDIAQTASKMELNKTENDLLLLVSRLTYAIQ